MECRARYFAFTRGFIDSEATYNTSLENKRTFSIVLETYSTHYDVSKATAFFECVYPKKKKAVAFETL
jgi:hypothetical protein